MMSRRHVLSVVAILLLSAACGSDDHTAAAPAQVKVPIELRGEGVRVTIDLDPFVLHIFDGAGREVLTSQTGPGATRDDAVDTVKVIPGWDGYEADEAPWPPATRVARQKNTATEAELEFDVDGGVLRLNVRVNGGRVEIEENAQGTVAGDAARPWNKTRLSFRLPADEHFFGLGERYASVDHRGLSIYSWAEEAGLGQGENAPPRAAGNPSPNGPSMTYAPVPFLLSTAGYGLHINETFRSEVHLGSVEPDAWQAAVNASHMRVEIYVGTPLAALDAYTRDTGRPMIPAPWVFGPRRRVDRGAMVDGREEWRVLRERGVPTTAVDDAMHFLPHRGELGIEDTLKAWTSTLHANGFKVNAYYNPYVSTKEPAAAEDYAYGVANKFFALAPDGKPGTTTFISSKLQEIAEIDLTSPQAVSWFQELMRRALRVGYDGWMHDFGEYTRRNWTFADGRKGDEVHNQFPVLSAKAAHDLLEAERPNDYLFFVRSAYSGSQAYVPAVWGGDPEATFDESQGLPAALRGGLNLGMSGLPYWGSDISGFKCFTDAPRDKEVYLRWAELGAVSPIMMDQNACVAATGSPTKWTLWSDAETTTVYGNMARLHTRLQPYFLTLAKEAHQSGIPLMRHPFLLFPDDPKVLAMEDSYFLGPSLFASPVVRRGVREKKTYLPQGRYVDLLDYAVYTGNQEVSLPAPLEKLPLLLVENHMVPMLDPSVQTLAKATEPGVVSADHVADRLDVIVALAPNGEARMTLADGTELIARRGNAGPADAWAVVTPEQLATCSSCYRQEPAGGVTRLRASTEISPNTKATLADVTLESQGPSARKIRWDVLSLP
jgi:alpha-glucosidase